MDKIDVIFLQFPNKTMEIAPLGTSILVGALKKNGYSAKQYDLNVVIKNGILEADNLKEIYEKILPYLLKKDMTDKSYKGMLYFYKLLDFLNTEYSYELVENVKNLLQSRRYVEVFESQVNTIIFENIMKILSFSTSFIEIVVSSECVEKTFPDFFFFKIIDSNILEVIEVVKSSKSFFGINLV